MLGALTRAQDLASVTDMFLLGAKCWASCWIETFFNFCFHMETLVYGGINVISQLRRNVVGVKGEDKGS